MMTFTKRTGLAVVASLALATSAAQAQYPAYGRPFPNTANYINRNPYVAPGMKLNQWAYNTAVVGRTYGSFPPWMYGYNPYPAVANYGNPGVVPYGGAPYGNPYTGGYGVGAAPIADPYAGGYAAGGYAPGGAGGYNPYSPYGGYGDPYGGYLRGQADVMRAYGQVALDFEQARITRQMAIQAKLETKKKSVELANWIRDNTLTWSQEQDRIAAQTLKRVQTSATQSEIWSGKAQNILLKNLAKNAKKGAVAPIPLDEEILKQINVTGNYGNLGLLRNNGKFTWPSAIQDLSDDNKHSELLQEISLETKQAFRQAVDANLDGKIVRDLRVRLDRLREQLAAKVNEIPIQQTLEAKRFLNDFDAAIVALGSKTDAAAYFDFQRTFNGSGKTVQELVDFMNRRGLHFAPAVPGDESAYQALQSALANYDIALGGGAQQFGSNKEY